MSFVIISAERYALDYGETVLGGVGPGSLDARELGNAAPFLIISYPVDGPATARRIAGAAVLLNGEPLADTPRALRHGDQFDAAGLRIVYGELRRANPTAHVSGPASAEAGPGSLGVPGSGTAATGGRLMRLSDRAVYPVPARGLTIGRDPTSDVLLSSKGTSRAHAVIGAGLLGYTLTDGSVNGVLVNGVRVEGAHLLGQGDILRFGQEDFRFEADEPSYEPDLPPTDAGTGTSIGDAPRPPHASAVRLLATLEVITEGATKGQRHRVERPTVQIGRGAHNEIRLDDVSVSTSHASLVQRASGWVIIDLGSRNGTFVDGRIIREQCELPRVCELRLGSLELLFRAIDSRSSVGNSTINVVDIGRR